MHRWHGRYNRKGHKSECIVRELMAQSRAQRALTRAKASLPTAGLPMVTTLTSAAGHCSAAHTPHSVACAQCFSVILHIQSNACSHVWNTYDIWLPALYDLHKYAWHGAGLRGGSLYTLPQRPVCYREGMEAACRYSPGRRPGCGPSNILLWAVCPHSCCPPHFCRQRPVPLKMCPSFASAQPAHKRGCAVHILGGSIPSIR